MNDWRYEPRKRYDVVTIPVLWLTIALSLLVHIGALSVWLPRMRLLSPESPEPGSTLSSLAVRLAPRPMPAATADAAASSPPALASPPQLLARSAPPRSTQPRRAIPRAQAPPPVIAMDRPAPPIAQPPPPPIAEPAPQPTPTPAPAMQPPLEPDLASYVEARRRARGESPSSTASAPSAEDEIQRRNRIIAANLGTNRPQTFGYDPKKSAGGMFEIEHLDESYAEFYFYGMDKDIGRNAKQHIEVRKGDNSNIRIAVVRRMIAIIRENVSGDFTWVSQRMGGRPILLSARPADNAALEEFILRDVFSDPHVPG